MIPLVPTGGPFLVLVGLGLILAAATIIALLVLVNGLIRALAKIARGFVRIEWRTDDVE